MKNPNCDGAGPCDPEYKEVRRMPVIGGPAVNLCRKCFRTEIRRLAELNKSLAEDCQYDLPDLTDLYIYHGE